MLWDRHGLATLRSFATGHSAGAFPNGGRVEPERWSNWDQSG